MAYQVKNQRRPDGTYTLSYGKGKKKLTAVMDQQGGRWRHDADRSKSYETMKACKESWGVWAARNYAGGEPPSPGPVPQHSVSLPGETVEEMQAKIDAAPTAADAEHAYHIFTAMEEVVRHQHEVVGLVYTPHKFRRRIPRRPQPETV